MKPSVDINDFTQSPVRSVIDKTPERVGSKAVKVFVSSIISGFGEFRAAARAAITTLRHEPIMAEDFGASPRSPQTSCLQGLRGGDLMVLVLGEKYGAVQTSSGLSATHEEYREARGRKPVIAFVQQGVDPEPEQLEFIAEVQGWEGGLFRGGFYTAEELQAGITRALHDYELASAVAPVDPQALILKARSMLPAQGRGSGMSSGGPVLSLAVAAGPQQQILRPIQIEAATLHEHLHQAALFGDARIFDRAKGVQQEMRNGALVLKQDGGAKFSLSEDGSIYLKLPLDNPSGQGRGFGMLVLIEEVVQRQISMGLSYAAMVLEHIDPTQRITHVTIAVRIDDAGYLGWRTEAENDASPNSSSISVASSEGKEPIIVSQVRPALRLNTSTLVEDILVPLRRQWKSR